MTSYCVGGGATPKIELKIIYKFNRSNLNATINLIYINLSYGIDGADDYFNYFEIDRFYYNNYTNITFNLSSDGTGTDQIRLSILNQSDNSYYSISNSSGSINSRIRDLRLFLNYTYNYSTYTNSTNATFYTTQSLISTLPNANFSVNDNITCSARPYNNSDGFGAWLNATTQTITDFYLLLCHGGIANLTNTTAVNFTGLYENNQSLVNISASGTITYNLHSFPTITKTFYPSISNLPFFQYCIYPTNVNFDFDYDLIYNIYGSTVTRSRSGVNVLINSIVTTIPLYTLADASQIKFRVVDSLNNPLSGATVTAQRDILGITYTVGTEVSDSSGMVYMYLDTTQTYTIIGSKTGYTSSTNLIKPTTVDIYTITLGTGTTTVVPPSTAVNYQFYPLNNVLTYNLTYPFTFNLTSSYWTITDCDITLKTGSTTLITAAGIFNASYCGAAVNYLMQNLTNVTLYGIYTINGTSFTEYKPYSINDYVQGNYSMKTILEDIKNFTGAGFNYQSRLLLTFIIIFIIIGVVSFKFNSLINPEMLLILQWGLVWLFSIIGWLTIESGISFPVIGVVDMAQWAIFTIDSLITAGYLIWRHT